MKKYRFAFDMGETSLGWAVFQLKEGKPVCLVKTGVQLFPSGRDEKGNSLAQVRRVPRGARRNQDRSLRRRKRLLAKLETAGLLPPPGAIRDAMVNDKSPYELRSRACVERVSLHEFGRALWHLAQRRGFKSNRKANKEADENGKIAGGSAQLETLLKNEGYNTVGQFLFARQAAAKPEDRETVRVRLSEKKYEFYPQRAMVEEEFDYIWAEQNRHHGELTEKLREEIRETIFYQRPLKPVPVGRCTFFPEEERLARWHELAQDFVIYSQLGHLRITHDGVERALTLAERDELAGRLVKGTGLTTTDAQKGLAWKKVRTFLGLPQNDVFNLEEGGETGLYVSPLPFRFRGTANKPGPFPEGFFTLPEDVRLDILTRLDSAIDEDDEAQIAQWAMAELRLSQEASEHLAKLTLPDGHIRVGMTAATGIVAELKTGQTLPDGERSGQAGRPQPQRPRRW
jgi:CRISPR-associated endonuclease Csn1